MPTKYNQGSGLFNYLDQKERKWEVLEHKDAHEYIPSKSIPKRSKYDSEINTVSFQDLK